MIADQTIQGHGAAQLDKMENKIWITFFLMLAGLAGWVGNDAVEDMQAPVDSQNSETDCREYIVLAYTETEKYMGRGCIGPGLKLTNTEEILSELG